MRRILPLILQLGLLAGSPLFADVVTLKDGRQISGSVESSNIAELRIKVGDQSQTIDIHQVQAIQLGVSPSPSKAAATGAAATSAAPAQPNSLILKDGTLVAGRLWSIDATDVHFLVNNQLQHYPRADVSGVTFGNATLPPPPAAQSTTTPAAPAQAPPDATEPARPRLTRSSPGAPPQPPTAQAPTLKRSSPSAPPPASPHGVSQPDEIGMVYFWNGRDLTILEHNQAAAHGSGAGQYFEIPAPKSPVRLHEAPTLVFVLRLAKGIDPAGYSLFPLVTVNGNRRTKADSGRRGVLMTWPVDIQVNDASSLMTYALTVRDLPPGEYSFSPSSSNDGYCFGVDASAPGQ